MQSSELNRNHEKLVSREIFQQNIRNKGRDKYTKGYRASLTKSGAVKAIREKFGIETLDKDRKKINNFSRVVSTRVLNHINRELIRALNMMGTIGFIDRIVIDDAPLKGAKAGFHFKTKTFILPEYFVEGDSALLAALFEENRSKGIPNEWSTCSPMHPYRHELGHAFFHYVCAMDSNAEERARELFQRYFGDLSSLQFDSMLRLSSYSADGPGEMIAEAFASIMDSNNNKFAIEIMERFRGTDADNK